MNPDELRTSIVERIEQLYEARGQQRKADDEVKRLKAEVNALRVKLAATDKSSPLEFAKLLGTELMSW
jgi:uncharacterized coiled-coil DUF342 family protein